MKPDGLISLTHHPQDMVFAPFARCAANIAGPMTFHQPYCNPDDMTFATIARIATNTKARLSLFEVFWFAADPGKRNASARAGARPYLHIARSLGLI